MKSITWTEPSEIELAWHLAKAVVTITHGAERDVYSVFLLDSVDEKLIDGTWVTEKITMRLNPLLLELLGYVEA